jgi:hypothetical protein
MLLLHRCCGYMLHRCNLNLKMCFYSWIAMFIIFFAAFHTAVEEYLPWNCKSIPTCFIGFILHVTHIKVCGHRPCFYLLYAATVDFCLQTAAHNWIIHNEAASTQITIYVGTLTKKWSNMFVILYLVWDLRFSHWCSYDAGLLEYNAVSLDEWFPVFLKEHRAFIFMGQAVQE